MPINTDLLFQYHDELTKKKYPDALVLGITFIAEIIRAFSHQNYTFDYTPASVVAPNLLIKGKVDFSSGRMRILHDFENLLSARNSIEIGSIHVDAEEIQGYVDGVTLFNSTFEDAPHSPSPESMNRFLEKFEPLERFDLKVQERAKKFVIDNATWACREFQGSDLVDGKNLMNKVVKRAATQNPNLSYQRGVRTARDTLFLYVDVILAFTEGRFEK